MKLGMLGLGRMGSNMARRLMRGGHECVVFDVNRTAVEQLCAEGARGASSLVDLLRALTPPRVVWLMLPAGDATEQTVAALSDGMQPGDIIVDGGNSYYKDDVRRATMLRPKEIYYLDAGTSGGVWGLERGYCLMIGGERDIAERLDPIFRTLAPGRANIPRTPGRDGAGGTAEEGYLYCGRSGTGHFVKMVHNGIEYGLMQSYAEGFDILRNASSANLSAEYRFDLNVADIAEIWRRGSVVSSWLLDLAAMALVEDPALTHYTGFVQDSGQGRWTVVAAIEETIPADVLATALFKRFRSRLEHTFAEKMLSAMRNKFGGHLERPSGG